MDGARPGPHHGTHVLYKTCAARAGPDAKS